ncbi:MAG: VCBS repeat-containing protein [Deltaproteobacteria bacterium]|nr:VCBS repeat-containing protein [Deltaproteobacteria bacterium]
MSLSAAPRVLLALSAGALFAPAAQADPGPCDTFSPSAAPSVFQVAECLNDPPVGTFNPVVERTWSANPVHSVYDDVMMTPVVGNLTDDNHDGKIDTDDVPDIAFTAYNWQRNDMDYRSPGALVVISGGDMRTHYSITAAGGYPIYGAGGVAIGDLEGDGSPDICVAGASNPGGLSAAVICMEADGSLKWAAGDENYVYGAPAIADMDNDGFAEVVFGDWIFDSTGSVLGIAELSDGRQCDGRNYMSFAVDWDGGGDLELVTGNAVFDMAGNLVWDDGDGEGIPAIGDFNGDQLPDMVKVTWGEVVVTLHDGTELWRRPAPGTGNGGAPTVADFDGDEEPEVGVAGNSYYTVYETNGDVLWSMPVKDWSSSVTGSSVFDFEGDGRAEVVYADEDTLWVFDGETGSVLMEEESHTSATLYEYPVIADVDGDDSTEIIIVSNDYDKTGTQGLVVIGDADHSWSPARPIWNQFAYHITNVNNDGSIPRFQTKNWLSWNNFRAGGTELGPSHWLSQVGAYGAESCLTACDEHAVEVYLPVYNEGWLDTSTIEVGFYRVSGSSRTLAMTATIPAIPADSSVMAGPFVIDQATWGTGDLIAVLDDPDDQPECDETDNIVELGAWPYPDSGDLWDQDGDGYTNADCGGEDCDDTDASIHPGALEVENDGVDQDCNGQDLIGGDCDQDGDGYADEDCGGSDCDDSDPSVHPEATDNPDDGIDQNCDGVDGMAGDAVLRQKCGCASSSASLGSMVFWFVGAGLTLIRRRSR